MSLLLWNSINICFISSTDSVSVFLYEQELSKFINYCNEVKAATAANKEGGQLSIVKPQSESATDATK